MTLSSSDTTLALRISQALQAYFDRERIVGPLRSNEAYEILARQGLIERDRYQGIKFREFLHRLRKENQLYLIPQCRFEETRGNQVNWFFESTPGKVPTGRKLVPIAQALQKKDLGLRSYPTGSGSAPQAGYFRFWRGGVGDPQELSQGL